MLTGSEILHVLLPQMKRNDETIRIINGIFSFADDLQFDEQYVFIFESDIYGVSFEMQMSVLSDLMSVVGKENVVVKPHPKTDVNKLVEYKLLMGSVPWEVYCLNNDMNKKSIVVMNSTAAFSPSMVLGDEPEIVFANDYPFFALSDFTKSCKIMQKKFIELYSNSHIYRVSRKDDFRKLCK